MDIAIYLGSHGRKLPGTGKKMTEISSIARRGELLGRNNGLGGRGETQDGKWGTREVQSRLIRRFVSYEGVRVGVVGGVRLG